VDAFIERTLARVSVAVDGEKHDVLRSAARLLGGVQAEAGFSDDDAVAWLIAELPTTARDLRAAEKTIRWALNVGRDRPVVVDERQRETVSTAFRLLRRGTASADLLAALHRQNRIRREPLPHDIIISTAVDCARRTMERADA
jgi:hypothetical protein